MNKIPGRCFIDFIDSIESIDFPNGSAVCSLRLEGRASLFKMLISPFIVLFFFASASEPV